MVIKVKIEFELKNGNKKVVEIGEKDPKGILRDKVTGEEREIDLTEKEVIMEYTKKIAKNIEEDVILFFMGLDQVVLIVNPEEVASVELNATTSEVIESVGEVQ